MFEHLREESLDALVEMDFPGYAVGGVSVGEPKEEMLRIMAHTPHRLPADKPRYLMGVGTPEDLVEGVAQGVDMFDCVMPTRNARNGHLFTRFGDLKIRNARHRSRRAAAGRDLQLLRLQGHDRRRRHRVAAASRAPTCTTWSAAARCWRPMLASIHNLHYYLNLMREIREALDAGRFAASRSSSAGPGTRRLAPPLTHRQAGEQLRDRVAQALGLHQGRAATAGPTIQPDPVEQRRAGTAAPSRRPVRSG